MPRGLRIGHAGLGGSDLYQAAADLAVGEDAAFSTGAQTAWVQDDWEWQSHGVHDPTNGRVHVMGKRANSDSAWRHRWYDIATNTWNTGALDVWDNLGHVYGNLAINPANGDVFIARGGLNGGGDNGKRLRWWKHSLQDWSSLLPASTDIYSGGLQDIGNGLACHPHWFGTNDPLVALDTNFRGRAVRVSTDEVFELSHDTTEFGQEYGIGLYWPAQDCLLLGGAGGNPLMKLTKNGTSAPTVSTFATPFIPTEGNSDSGAGGFGSLHVNPTNPETLILVERGGSYRWWTCDSAGTFTRRDTTYGAHPFQFRPFTVVPIPEIGCLWALGANNTPSLTHYSHLWKPDV